MDGWVHILKRLFPLVGQMILTPTSLRVHVAVALDTGFATAMHVRPKWLRDILSMLFSGYYLFFANEADEKVGPLSFSSHSRLLADQYVLYLSSANTALYAQSNSFALPGKRQAILSFDSLHFTPVLH